MNTYNILIATLNDVIHALEIAGATWIAWRLWLKLERASERKREGKQ